MTDLIVVGSGLSGLFASLLASKKGLSVTLVSKGRGALSLSHGCIDIWARAKPSLALPKLKPPHPYALARTDALREAVAYFKECMHQAELPFVGDLSTNIDLPTSAGIVRTTCFMPQSMAHGNLGLASPIALASIDIFQDFNAGLAASQLERIGISVEQVVQLPMLPPAIDRLVYGTDLAMRFDDPIWRRQTIAAWKPLLVGIRRLGLPAILGLHHHAQTCHEIEEELGLRLFEIPTLPPNVPGLRIENALRRMVHSQGINIIEGSHAIGRVDGRSKGTRVSGVMLQGPSGPRRLSSASVILATGGILHGGLLSTQRGELRESVFDLPVAASPDRDRWLGEAALGPQPYARYGVATDDQFRPITVDGTSPLFENLYAIGGLLTGADRSMEGSRQGIDLATAYRAVQALST